MSRNRFRRLDHAVELITSVLADAVRGTIEESSPEPAREVVQEFADADMPEDESLLPVLTIVLLHWLDLLRTELADQPDRVDEGLGWVAEHLGNRYRLRARLVSPPLEREDSDADVAQYIEGLGADFVPAMIWLIAGVVARYRDGDAGWLRELQDVRRRDEADPVGLGSAG